MSRGASRLGYGDADTNTPVTPSELNDVYTHGQFFVPAGSLTPDATNPFVLEQYDGSATDPLSWTVGKFAPSTTNEGFFSWGFKSDFIASPSASLLIKVAPLYFAKTTETTKNSYWGCACVNSLVAGTTIDFDAGPEVHFTSRVQATNILSGGIVANNEAVMAPTVLNQAISADNWNFLTFMIEREASNVADTYTADLFLMGVCVQFAVDFDNLAVWPTS